MIEAALAQAAPGHGPPAWVSMLPLVLVVLIFYFLLIRPQQQKAREHEKFLAGLKRNDEVITNGGLYGKIIALTEDVVTLEVAPNVRVRVSRSAIAGAAAKPKEKK